jgi:molybdopterin molybdotransferase
MAQLSDDCFAQGGKLMRADEALALLGRSVVRITESEAVALDAALGRILAEDVAAPHDVPAHDNSAVDGYAVFFDDLDAERDTVLPVTGRASAGHPLGRAARRGEAIRIFTGGVMPEGPDCVMMQEDCEVHGENVVLRPGLKRGANRRLRGEDIAVGQTVLRAGARLRPQDLGQAAAVGRRELLTSKPLRVALFSTGDELREPGAPLEPGCIYDSNRTTIHGLLTGMGCAITDLGILKDEAASLRAALESAAHDHDLVVTSGGVSVGEEDHVRSAVEALGRLHLWRLAIKPGRPIALGQIGAAAFVGLPGNPVAVMVTFLNLVRPMILRLMGGTELTPHHFRVPADFSHKKKKDRREWLRARLVADGAAGWRAVKYPRQGAGILSSMVESEGLVALPEEVTAIEPGTMVDFLPFSEVAS